MDAIILTERQAQAVPKLTEPGYGIEPVPMRDGRYWLPARVLTHVGYAEAWQAVSHGERARVTPGEDDYNTGDNEALSGRDRTEYEERREALASRPVSPRR